MSWRNRPRSIRDPRPTPKAIIERQIEENARNGFDSSGNPIGSHGGYNWYHEDIRTARQVGDVDSFRELTDQNLIGESK